jgi:polysaccharide biosynthesis transport protein
VLTGSNEDLAEQRPDPSGTGRLMHALRRRAPLVIGCTLLTACLALVFSLTQTKQYTGRASLLFRDPGFDSRLFGSSPSSNQDPTREAATNITLVSLDAVADRTARTFDRSLSGDEISNKVSVQSEGQSDVASVQATDPDPEIAADLANAFAANYIVFRRDADRRKVLEAQRLVQADFDRLPPEAQAGSEGQSLQRQISRLSTLAALQTGNAELVQRATVPTSPSAPKTARNTVLGLVLGLLLGVGAAFLLERLDRRLREPDDFQQLLRLPILAEITESKALADPAHGVATSGPEGAAFQMMRARLRYFNVDRNIQSVLITSAAPEEGKTTIARNLVASGALAGLRTVLVEADLHQPSVARAIGIHFSPGLSELLSDQSSLESVSQKIILEEPGANGAEAHGFDVIVAGSRPPNPVELLDSDGMRDLVATLDGYYDLIVIDSPPLPVVPDAIPLATMVGGVIVVARVSKTTRDEANAIRVQLESLNAPVLGVVLNRTPRKWQRYYGYDTPQPARSSDIEEERHSARSGAASPTNPQLD